MNPGGPYRWSTFPRPRSSRSRVSNPAKWMATANDTLELVNFFESTNTSYEGNAKASVGSKG